MKKLFLSISILFFISSNLFSQIGATGNQNAGSPGANGTYGTAFGAQNNVPGEYSLVAGARSTVDGDISFGLGSGVYARGDGSFAFGVGVNATATNSWIFGSGLTGFGTSPFENDIANSFMIGFNTSTPSLFVESFTTGGADGFVGIHTTNPQTALDVNGTISGKGLKVTPFGASIQSGMVLMADGTDGTVKWDFPSGGGSGGNSYWNHNTTTNSIYYTNGNVGVGPSSSNPQEKLHVFGNFRINGYMRGGESSGALKVQSNYGYTKIGAKSSSASHFETDRGRFEFNKRVVVDGNVTMDNSNIYNDIIFYSGDDHLINFGTGTSQIRFGTDDPGINSFEIKSVMSSAPSLYINNTGKIAINHNNPTEELDVNGTIKTTELKVTGGTTGSGYVLADPNGSGTAVWTDIGSIGGGNDPIWTENGSNVYREEGNVGIGTSSPQAKLHLDFGTDKPGLRFANDGTVGSNVADFRVITGVTDGLGLLEMYNTNWGTNYNWTCGASASNGGKVEGMRLTIVPYKNGEGYYNSTKLHLNGRMGINSPVQAGHTLSVNGVIGCKKVVVTLLDGDWPDFVFSDEYELPELSDIETYVKENKHLPGVPTAAEVKENGQDLGEMNAILLQKIEELTLLMIEQQKEIDALKTQVKQ
jgi:hypothetical protein